MKVAFIHSEKKIGTGAHYINDLMGLKVKESGVEMKNFYPRASLVDAPAHLSGLKSILFFYSLLERRKEILKYDIIQGTTYTPLPFLVYPVPVICHFGSTTRGFLNATPAAGQIESSTRKIWYNLKKEGAIKELNIKTRRPLRDIAEIEEYVASRATAVIATSENVKKELLAAGINGKKIHLLHNAIEDYWFDAPLAPRIAERPSIVFLGRIGSDSFTLKLKGLDRLIHIYKRFSEVPKYTFCITANKTITGWLRAQLANHTISTNIQKDRLPALLNPMRGSVLFLPSRYEGFSLSLIEGMSQGLIPVTYPIGVAPEIIRNGENGFIVNSQAEAIEKIDSILLDSGLRERLSLAARYTSTEFMSGHIARKLIDLYGKIIKESQKKTGNKPYDEKFMIKKDSSFYT